MSIRDELLSMREESYRDFTAKLIPTVDKERIIGIRAPILKSYAKALGERGRAFLGELPHLYYEENNLHALIICLIRDFDECVVRLNEFLPFVDNWATCDGIRPICFAKNKDKLIKEIRAWINSNHAYTLRFGIEMLMVHFLDSDFSKEYADAVAGVSSDEYYVNMMIAWYFATALTKRWEDALPYLEGRRLSPWVHKKTVQKACESLVIPCERKKYLKNLL